VAEAYDAIKARILRNEYGPGFQATEPEIAAALKMSRTPVREALVRLQQEGLLHVVPRRGMRVLPVAPSDMREIYEVLTALETMAVELLARRRPTAGDVVPLERALAAMDAALDRGDLQAWAMWDERFHRGILDQCGNQRLAALAGTVWDQVHRARLASLKLRPVPRRSVEEHRQVLDAIRRGRPATARNLHCRHRTRTAALLVGLLERYQMPGL
jgi:DNA-binding GntR family transcriptional regulator